MIYLKSARRQARRYGTQAAELHNSGRHNESEQVLVAYLNFMRQFMEDRVIVDWLTNEFILGKRGDDALSGFVMNEHDGTITKTYHVK